MRGINYQSLLKNWDTVIHKLCEEVSTHDVLEIINKQVNLMIYDFKSKKLNTEKLTKAAIHLEKALELLNPEG